MNLYEEHVPRHSKIYTDLIPIIEDVFTRYSEEVKSRAYPGPEHTVYMKPEELSKFAKQVDWKSKL
jgi:3-methyl-2-oxobutanoate hydroxymethyltransferase